MADEELDQTGDMVAVDDGAGQTTGGQETDASSGNQGNEQVDEKLPFHKDPAVQEYIERQIEKRLSEYEQKIKENSASSNPKEDTALKELLDLGFGEKEATRMLKVIDMLAEKRISPFREESQKSRVDQTFKDFISSHKNVSDELWGEMNGIFNSFTKEEQHILVRNPKSLQMIYAMAKTNLNSDYEKGKQDGVTNARRKKEGGNMSGSPSGDSELTDENINKMLPEEFNRREKEIMAKLHKVQSEEEE